MFRSSFRFLTSLVLVAAAPLAARFFMQSSRALHAPVVSNRQSGKKTGNDQKGAKPADSANHNDGNRKGSSDADSDSVSPRAFAARGRAVGRDELNQNIEGFCREYAGMPTRGSELSCPETSERKLYAVIAVLPDPVHTHLALRFDRGIDDIEDAMEDLGWTFDHSWLPWDNKVYPDTDRYEDREADSAEQRGREENPGVLFFRGPDVEQPQSDLMVLVVGDTPTAGVNPKQFRGAMDTWRSLVRSGSVDHDELAILGPTFSGSVQSLRHLLNQELNAAEPSGTEDCVSYAPPHVDIASGTVTSADRLAGLEAILDRCGHLVASNSVSFGIDSEYQSFQLIHFLLKHIPHERIMRLNEAESSFGAPPAPLPGQGSFQDLLRAIDASSCGGSVMKCEEQKAQQESFVKDNEKQQEERKEAGGETEFQIPVLHFPREISALRKAYEENSIVGFGSAPNSPRTQLSLRDAEDTHDDDDTVATFSGQQSTLAMETEMSLIATKLSTENYSVVLLSATDMLDEIFVARYLQQHAPGVTVIVEDADLMFLRSGEDAGLNDVYVASPWPLMEENQRWSGSGDPANPHLFQSQSDEGLHNAVVYLMCGQPGADRKTGQTACGPGPMTLYDYRPPLLPPGAGGAVGARAPLWLSVIGHGQFYPIALVDVDQTGAGLPEVGDLNLPAQPFRAAGPLGGTIEPEQTPTHGLDVKTVIPAVKLVAALIAVLLAWHGAPCWRARLDRRFAWTYALAEAEHRCYRLGLQALMSACAIPALGLLWIPSMPGLIIQHGTFRTCIVALQFGAALLATWPALRWFCGSVPFRGRARPLLKAAGVMVGLAALIFVVDNYLWKLITPLDYTERLFFLYRNSQLLCGSSPALTLGLLLAATAFWLHSHFGRLAFFGHRIPELPYDHEYRYCPSPRSVRPITDLLTTGAPRRMVGPENIGGRVDWRARLTLLSAALVGLVLLIANTGGPQSIARSGFDYLVRVLTYIVAVLIVRDVAIAVCGWRLLEELCLQPLKRSPLRWGFSWIKGFSWRKIWKSYRTMSPEVMFDYMMRLKESNQRIGGDKELQEKYAILSRHYYEPREGRNEVWANRIAEDVLNLHRELGRVASKKLWTLRTEWDSDRGAITGTEEKRGRHYEYPIKELKKAEREQSLDRMAGEEFAALLYLGYIRMVLVQIRNRIVTASVTYVLLLWSLTSYPWMNRHAILIWLCLLLALISAATLYIYSAMHRDDILSRTTETEPGKLDREFFEKVIPTIGIPLLTLVATQFPALSNFIFSWVEPGLKGP
jgi:hypothetical protein